MRRSSQKDEMTWTAGAPTTRDRGTILVKYGAFGDRRKAVGASVYQARGRRDRNATVAIGEGRLVEHVSDGARERRTRPELLQKRCACHEDDPTLRLLRGISRHVAWVAVALFCLTRIGVGSATVPCVVRAWGKTPNLKQ
ncbi:MAG: hypothetical protein ABI229_02975 [Gemmatimonadaceae bacterium]